MQVSPIEQPPVIALDMDPLAPRAPVQGQGNAVDFTSVAAPWQRSYTVPDMDRPTLQPRDGPIAGLNPDRQGVFAASLQMPVMDASLAVQNNPDNLVVDTELAGLAITRDVDVKPSPPVSEPVTEIEVFATQDVWLRVLAGDGSVLFEDILEGGERFVVPQTAADTTQMPMIERAGNAGALYFSVNGAVYGPAGQGTRVVKEISLAENDIKDRFLPMPGADMADMVELALSEVKAETATE